MEFLEWQYFDNPVSRWLTALTIGLGAWILLMVLRSLIRHYLSHLVSKTATTLDDLAIDLLKGTKWFLLLAIALLCGAYTLELPTKIQDVLKTILIIALLCQVIIWGNRIITYTANRYRERGEETKGAAITLLTIVGRITLVVIAALLILDNLGINITTLIAGLGIGGIAIALALQNILGDLFASFTIVFDKPFEIGDFIIVGDLLGTVEHVGLKTTRVRSLSGEQLVFGNGDLLSSRIRNYKRMFERRVVFQIGVTYQTLHEKLQAIPIMIRKIIEQQENSRFDRAHFKAYGAFSLDFEIVYYVLVPDYNTYMDTQQAINLAIYKKFEEEKIEFAYPTQTLYMQKEMEVVSS